jgi:hypothetical protein
VRQKGTHPALFLSPASCVSRDGQKPSSFQGGERAAIAAVRTIVSQAVAFPLRWGCVSVSGRDATDYGDSQVHVLMLGRSIHVVEKRNTMRHFLSLVSVLIALTLLATPAVSAAPPIMKAQIALSETNQPDSLWAASDSQLVYRRDNPAMHPPSCVSCDDPPFTDFRGHSTRSISTPRARDCGRRSRTPSSPSTRASTRPSSRLSAAG